MSESRNYKTGGLLSGLLVGVGEERERALDGLTAAIYNEFNVRNILVWETQSGTKRARGRRGTQHWRDDCPALRRATHAKSRLVPREEGMTKPCKTCAEVERRENEGMRAADAARMLTEQIEKLLAVVPPADPPMLPNGKPRWFLVVPSAISREIGAEIVHKTDGRRPSLIDVEIAVRPDLAKTHIYVIDRALPALPAWGSPPQLALPPGGST